MDNMADVVKDNSKELQLKAEKEYIKQCAQKDELARQQDVTAKSKARVKHQQLNEMRANQMREKRERQEIDM